MDYVFLILLFILVIIIFGENTVIRIALCAAAALLFITNEFANIAETPSPSPSPSKTEDFTVVNDLEREYVREMPSYSNYVQYEPELRGFNDRFVKKQQHTGSQAAFINRGAAKNRINYARRFYEEDMEYNDRLDWWNDDRTFDEYDI